MFIWLPFLGVSQQDEKVVGTVSFKTSQNIYVRFSTTEKIKVGDTLSWLSAGSWQKSLVVRQKSSTSCVTESLSPVIPDLGQEIVLFTKKTTEPIPVKEVTQPPKETEIQPAETLDKQLTEEETKQLLPLKKQMLQGRLTLSTNASINPGETDNFQRIRASMALNIQNINESDFSVQSYFTYRHRYGIDQSTTDFYDDAKILTLAAQWQPNDNFQLWLGRKNNRHLANLGSIDGVQGEYSRGKYAFGTFGGTRPDFQNFTFNAQLPQFGVYLVRKDQYKVGSAETSLAVAEQQNDFKTDRRFVYLQHQNQFIKNVQFFFSTELDLFRKVQADVSYRPRLTSLYTSVRYRIRKNLSVSASYDNRRNVIYYESYQTYIDQLLAQETRQGFRFQAQWTVFKKFQLNASSFYRFQGDNPKPTQNYVAGLNMNRILGNRLNVSLTYNQMVSYYFQGTIIGGRVSDNIWKGKMQLELNYRHVNYAFNNNETSLQQHITGLNVSWNVFKNTTLIWSYENTLEPSRTWHRYFITLSQRIKN